MNEARGPVVIRALREKAAIVRQVAADLKLTYLEEDVPGESDLILFRFSLADHDMKQLVKKVPVEVYAYRAEFE